MRERRYLSTKRASCVKGASVVQVADPSPAWSRDGAKVRERIVVAHSDWLTARGVQQSLLSAGYSVEVVSTPTALVDAPVVDGSPPGAAILEMSPRQPALPDVAIQLCLEHRVPVVWVSDVVDLQALTRLPPLPSAGWLVAPFHENQLLASVAVAAQMREMLALAGGRGGSPVPAVSGGHETSSESGVGRSTLTPRQLEIVDLLAQGGRVSTIAEDLGLTESAVRGHLRRIFSRLQVRSQAQLIRALRAPTSASPVVVGRIAKLPASGWSR